MRRWMKGTVAGIVGLGIIGVGVAWYVLRGGETEAGFRTAAVKRGDLLVSISATGTLVPEEVIDVGAQIAGQIMSFGRDAAGRTVDYGSAVEEGTVLAKIDDSLYAADAAQAEAQVQAGKAALQRAEADLGQLRAKLHQAERDWQRAQKLGPSETAAANLAVGQAAILQARASLAQSEASFRRAQRNLSYTTIKSPVKGVIIDRRVNIGQTVVASLNAPSLFLIAKDLKRMQVWVAVNEADIGKIRPGQAVTFTVDAFPGETFRGEVGKIRLNASMTQNVVTYTVEVVTDNSSGRLLPYLTANVQFELNRRADVFQVPNAALRFRPTPEQIAPEFRDAFASAAEGRAKPKEGQRPGAGPAGDVGAQASRGNLWLPAGERVRPLGVKVGLSDNAMTEVSGENLTEGLEIVTGMQLQASAKPDTSTPFTPSFTRGGGTAGAGRPR
jgi:HlyD family secretion protein